MRNLFLFSSLLLFPVNFSHAQTCESKNNQDTFIQVEIKPGSGFTKCLYSSHPPKVESFKDISGNFVPMQGPWIFGSWFPELDLYICSGTSFHCVFQEISYK